MEKADYLSTLIPDPSPLAKNAWEKGDKHYYAICGRKISGYVIHCGQS